MSSTDPASLPATVPDRGAASDIASAILGFIGEVPRSDEVRSDEPAQAAARLARAAAAKAATAAGTLALPPGPLGWLTVLPEMVAVWRIQSAMVADIAALHGRSATLTREQMLYCLFRHSASQAVRDLVVRAGERFVVKRTTLRVMRAVARRIGAKLSERTLVKAASRWLPVAGAIGVAAYAYYDTQQVARAATELFARDIDIEAADDAA